jgi:hypothetical protein
MKKIGDDLAWVPCVLLRLVFVIIWLTLLAAFTTGGVLMAGLLFAYADSHLRARLPLSTSVEDVVIILLHLVVYLFLALLGFSLGCGVIEQWKRGLQYGRKFTPRKTYTLPGDYYEKENRKR